MITDPRHRLFYVNNKLEFALFYNKTITDKEKIKEEFLSGRDWKDYVRYHSVKLVTEFTFSEDLKTIYIKTKTAKLPKKD